MTQQLEKKVADLTMALMEAKRANELLDTKYQKVKEDNNGLLAQNARYRDHLKFIVSSKSYGNGGAKTLLQSTPEVCLNEIVAESVLKFAGTLLAKYRYDITEWAKEYADKVRGV